MRRIFDISNVTEVTIFKEVVASANICFAYYVKDTLQTATRRNTKAQWCYLDVLPVVA